MKRVALLVLALLMLVTAIPMSGVFADKTAETGKTEKLPSSFTLVGTKHLPPVSNQGAIGSCASSSITYMQFTNAVSRYLHSIDPDIEWDPSSGDKKYLFSPKFTYNFAGSGTEWVYKILIENGCLTQEDSHFLTDASGAYQEKAEDKVSPQSASWDVGEGMMEKALNYRLSDYEQIWIKRDANSYGVDGKVQLTTTDRGRALINKVKASLVDGNVVVTGGLSSCWYYANGAVVQNTDLAKKGENVMFCGRGDWVGGHQVCIVGYDDNLIASVPNKNGGKTTLKGAFLMVNSWGEGYQNGGYVWIMYDAFNEVSEYEELNFDDRKYPMDQFCFTDWRTDVVANVMPELYLEVGIGAGDRSQLDIQLISRMIEMNKGTFRSYSPYIFQYAGHNGDFNDVRNYNFDGLLYKGQTAKSAVGYFTFPIGNAVSIGKVEKLMFGVKVSAKGSDSVTVFSLKLKNGNGEVLSSVSFPDGVVAGGKTGEFFADPVKLVHAANFPKVEGATITSLTGNVYVKSGSDVSFKVTPDSKDKVAKVIVDGTELLPDADGVYTIKNKTAETKLSIELIDAPTPKAKEDKGGNTGVIVTIAIVAVAAVVVVGGCVVLLGKKKKKVK